MTPTTPREALEKSLCSYRPEYAEMAHPLTCEIDAILTALAPFMPEWRPIEEAPKDGTWLLVWSNYNWGNVWPAYWKSDKRNKKNGGYWCSSVGSPGVREVTHFMPFPNPPQVTNEKA